MIIKWVTAFSVMAFISPSTNSKTTPSQRSNHSKVAKSSKITKGNKSSSRTSTRTPKHKHSKILVVKFGGSSLADSERITKAAKSVAKNHYFYFSPKNQHFSKIYKKDFYQKYLKSKSINSEFCGIVKNVVA